MPVFITLEGIDHSGKSTQFQMLVQHLQEQGRDFIHAREPGGTPLGERLREIILSPESRMTVHTEAFLYASCRSELVDQVVRPALESGRSVVLDRFVDSSLAYQGFGRGLPVEFVHSINAMGTGDLRPHRTILLDLPVPIALERKADALKDRLERMDRSFHERVREGYLELAEAEPRRIKVVDAAGPTEEVHRRVVKLIEEIWPGSGAASSPGRPPR